eukprot:5268579-Prymnesium_polylepis.2
MAQIEEVRAAVQFQVLGVTTTLVKRNGRTFDLLLAGGVGSRGRAWRGDGARPRSDARGRPPLPLPSTLGSAVAARAGVEAIRQAHVVDQASLQPCAYAQADLSPRAQATLAHAFRRAGLPAPEC